MEHTYLVERLSDLGLGYCDRIGHVAVWQQTVKAESATAALRAADKVTAVERSWPIEAIDPKGEYAQAIDPTQVVEVEDHAAELIAVSIICDRGSPCCNV